MSYQAPRQRPFSLVPRIVIHSLLLVVLTFLIHAGLMEVQFRHALRQQADLLAQSLLLQTESSARDLLVARDLLSLNVLLSRLVENPLVAHATLYSKENRLLAEAGTPPAHTRLPDLPEVLGGAEPGPYSMPVRIQEAPAGQLTIELDMARFRQPQVISQRNMGLLGLGLLILALWLGLRLGRSLSTPLLQLRLWAMDPRYPAPATGRRDEIGELARQLEQQLASAPEPEPAGPPSRPAAPASPPHSEPELSLDGLVASPPPAPAAVPTLQPASGDSGQSAVLAVQLNVPATQAQPGLLQQQARYLEQVAQLYRARLHQLRDGHALLLFHRRGNEQNYLTHALCCGGLLKALAEGLQQRTGSSLALQLGLAEGERLGELNAGELLLSPTVQQALELARHRHGQQLVSPAASADRLTRQRVPLPPARRPARACSVTGLSDPYPGLLERQRKHIEASSTP